MKSFLHLLTLFAIANVECRLARLDSPEIQIIPTGIIPQICVTAKRELPPCGIGKFKKTQHDYEEKIEKIRQSYVDMIIDFKDTKDISFENLGPGRIYLESFESLDRQLHMQQERNVAQEATEVNSSKIKIPKNEDKSTISIVRVISSVTTTVITATECIPLGVEFCDNFPRPAVDEDTEISKIQKRSLPSIPELFRHLWNSKSKENRQHEIIPQNREDFFRRVDKRSIPGDSNHVDNQDNPKINSARLYGGLYEIISPRSFNFSESKENVEEVSKPGTRIGSLNFLTVHKKIELYDMMEFLEKRFGVKKYEEAERPEN